MEQQTSNEDVDLERELYGNKERNGLLRTENNSLLEKYK